MQVSEFLDMGGYAAFVWPAFAVTAIVMIAILWASLARLRSAERLLGEVEATRPRRGADGGS